jgi:hypothetical protein
MGDYGSGMMLIGIFIGGSYVVKEFDKEIDKLGLSKRDVKGIFVVITLFFLYKNYKKTIVKTVQLANTARVSLIKSHI